MKKQTWIRAAIICVIAAAVLIAGIILLKSNDDSQYSEKRGNMTEGFGQLKTVEIGGVKYREKPAVTTLLICGIDVPAETDDISEATYRNAGMADLPEPQLRQDATGQREVHGAGGGTAAGRN